MGENGKKSEKTKAMTKTIFAGSTVKEYLRMCVCGCVRMHLRMHEQWERRRGCVHLETAGTAY